MMKGLSRAVGDLPVAGSKLRLVYDVLYEHRGRAVPSDEWGALYDLVSMTRSGHKSSTLGRILSDLRDFYGCDVRSRALVGEWFGRVYVDYTEPAVEALEWPGT